MPRYVDADKVIDVMKAAYWDENMHSAKDDPCVIDAMIDWAIRQVKDAPTEVAATVMHAHWTDDGECSNCGGYQLFEKAADRYMYWRSTSAFCPLCGAIMDEVTK